MKFYYETSFVNYLYDKYKLNDIIATRVHQSLKGNELYISTVTLWEILLTSDVDRRNGLMKLCQYLFEPVLLKSPTEVCFDFIIQGFPSYQLFKDGKSKMKISDIWTTLVEQKDHVIEYDFESFKDVAKQLKTLSKGFSKYIDNVIFDAELSTKEQIWGGFLNDASNEIFKEMPTENPHLEKIRRISVLVSYYLLCVGMDIENSICNSFWRHQCVSEDPLVRMSYLMEYFNGFFHGGPIESISNIIYFQKVQTNNKPNRGTIHDGFHSVYLPFVDVFLTNDEGFKNFKECATVETYNRIFHTSEVTFTHKIMEIVMDGL